MKDRVLILGCGYAGSALARLARAEGLAVVANVRSDGRAAALRAEGFAVLQLPELDESIASHLTKTTQVVIAYPPDPVTDARVAKALARGQPAGIAYVSSTGVYGEQRGIIDDRTRVPPPNPRAARILAAEALYRQAGATVFRPPALYGPDRGLHVRVLRGEHRIPGDGLRFISRVHVNDLGQFILAAARGAHEGATFVVGDLAPAPHLDVVQFVCDAYRVPLPPFVPLTSVPESLRADRRVDPSQALARLGVRLRFPTFREGMAPAATGLTAASAMQIGAPMRTKGPS